MTPKRQKIEALLDGVLKRIDTSGVNANKYKAMFAKMSDQQFTKWINDFLKDDKSNIRLDIEEFGNDNRKLKYENVEAAAKFLGVPIFEYVYIPHVSADPNRPVRTKHPVMVGYLNLKRTQQFVTKKTGVALTDTNRDELTGAARGESKSGTQTGIENELLAGVGADKVLSELTGVRGDNITEYDNMLSAISETGKVSLENIKTGVYDKPTLLRADIYFLAMGIKTDLISESYYSIDRVKAAQRGEKLTP